MPEYSYVAIKPRSIGRTNIQALLNQGDITMAEYMKYYHITAKNAFSKPKLKFKIVKRD